MLCRDRCCASALNKKGLGCWLCEDKASRLDPCVSHASQRHLPTCRPPISATLSLILGRRRRTGRAGAMRVNHLFSWVVLGQPRRATPDQTLRPWRSHRGVERHQMLCEGRQAMLATLHVAGTARIRQGRPCIRWKPARLQQSRAAPRGPRHGGQHVSRRRHPASSIVSARLSRPPSPIGSKVREGAMRNHAHDLWFAHRRAE